MYMHMSMMALKSFFLYRPALKDVFTYLHIQCPSRNDWIYDIGYVNTSFVLCT